MALGKFMAIGSAAVVWTLLTLAASAEISGVGDGVARAENGEPLRVLAGDALHLRCWQNGVQIIDEADLASVSVKSLLKPETLLLGGGGEAARVVVLSLEESTCLVQARGQ